MIKCWIWNYTFAVHVKIHDGAFEFFKYATWWNWWAYTKGVLDSLCLQIILKIRRVFWIRYKLLFYHCFIRIYAQIRTRDYVCQNYMIIHVMSWNEVKSTFCKIYTSNSCHFVHQVFYLPHFKCNKYFLSCIRVSI